MQILHGLNVCVTVRARVDHVRDWCERDLLVLCDCFCDSIISLNNCYIGAVDSSRTLVWQ